MSKNLLIVESPAKAKTIEKYLGSDFSVVSCYGHIRDLPGGELAVEVDKNYSPKYVVPKEKEALVKQLKKDAKAAGTVWLATDEDREGEAISWHLCEVLGLDPKETKRIVFHEITKPAILKAMENPRFLNLDLVQAQQARRVLDRLVGFEVSPILWRKMSLKQSLSAGRVQSVAVRLIVEREREIQDFKPVSSYQVTGTFLTEDGNEKAGQVRAKLPTNLKDDYLAHDFLELCAHANFRIPEKGIEVKPVKRSPSPPFTTSTLQQEASRKLGFSVSRTMTVAQKLYEAGKITYMRTDSVNLSETALTGAADTIGSEFGDKYVHTRRFSNKNASAQEAHEAIRPTDMKLRTTSGTNEEKRLYELIWKRTIASQMADALLERTIIQIDVLPTDKNTVAEKRRKELPNQLQARGEIIKFDGFLKLYMESTDEDPEDDDSTLLPPLKEGQELFMLDMAATERFTRNPPRYTEAALVKKLEELGIGRPSTYAPTISTVQKRGYVTKEDRTGTERQYTLMVLKNGGIKRKELMEVFGNEKAKLFPTDVGMLVTDFLLKHFPNIMDYQFTAQIEKQFDDIAAGGKKWDKMIDGFYKPFHQTVETTIETADRMTGERELGTDPKTGKLIITRMGKFGPMVQLGGPDDEVKQYARLRGAQNLETVTLEQALELFKLPRKLGAHEDEEVVASEGRFGPYVMYRKKFYTLKGVSPLEVTLEEALTLIKEKDEEAQKRLIQEFKEDDILVLDGQYGPYIKSGKRNYKLPKGTDAASLTLDECKEIIENAPEPRKGPVRRRRS